MHNIKICSKWIIKLNVKSKTLKLQKGESFCNFELDKDFLYDTNSTIHKRKK